MSMSMSNGMGSMASTSMGQGISVIFKQTNCTRDDCPESKLGPIMYSEYLVIDDAINNCHEEDIMQFVYENGKPLGPPITVTCPKSSYDLSIVAVYGSNPVG